ncbi:MAG: AAA domain-containing protein [Clostridiaceae bacterium]|nr:AAA domain-containing protein [Clostridiaceae bacterium]
MNSYKMSCPVHHSDMLMKGMIKVNSPRTGTKDRPLFFCFTCKRYYVFSPEIKGVSCKDTGKKINDFPIYYTSTRYIDLKTKEARQKTASNTSAGIWKQSQNANKSGTKGKTNIVGDESKRVDGNGEKAIRVHKLELDDIDDGLKTNFNSIRTAYPQLVTEQMSINDLITKIFPGNIQQKVVIRNVSFNGSSGTMIRCVEIYNKNSSYLSHRLPSGIYLSFGGRVTNGEFYVKEIRLLENPILKEDDTQANVIFYYDGPNHANWLYNLTDKVAEHTETLEGELADWNDYLEWKRQLAELRIRGMKYIGFRLDVEEREVTFLTVTEGKSEFENFRKYLRRNEVSVFSNYYSKNRWHFEFKRDYQDSGNNDSGIPLAFVRIENTYGILDIDEYSWDSLRSSTKKYEEKDKETRTRYLVNEIRRNYIEPYLAEIVFEFSSYAMSTVDRQIRNFGMVADDIEKTLAGEFYGDGYIATSQIGDFALLKRLKRGVQDLANGKAASQGLDQWLFDITKAREPKTTVPITYWQNTSLNVNQKQAVEKILSVPDVCLIQGPPGTGKTTVIAEAIYQLVIQNKRVLVASQANLAVDNALERLISNPKIRAIRLGSARKIDSSVNNITEENVLESFYASILQYVNGQYLKKWDRIDAVKEEGEYDIRRYQNAIEENQKIDRQIQNKQEEIDRINAFCDSDAEYETQNALGQEKANLILLQSYCQGNSETLELMLPKESILAIWVVMEPLILTIKAQGVYLTKVGVDTGDLNKPQRINSANGIIKHTLKNARLASKLLIKLNSSDQFGGNLRELEELKIQEAILKEKVLKDTRSEDLEQWKAISKKIAEFNNSGAGLTEAERQLFDESSVKKDGEESKQYMLNVLKTATPLIQTLWQDVENASSGRLDTITEQQKAFDDRSEENEHKKELLEQEIATLKQGKQENRRLSDRILRKYNATPENLKTVIDHYCKKVKQKNKAAIDREDWEGIFRGLEKWVYNIPDYTQEKDVFLKDYINSCNVVGVSCTENTRTLTDNGFDDFDVVIIDEVSKATPPELLIPMLRGRKIVLVGDHRQLPPLFNEHEKTYQEVAEQQEDMDDVIVPLTMSDFNKYKDMVTSSLFERYFEKAGAKIKETLTDQYRMHFDIMDIINIFYDQCLKDGNEDQYTYDTKAHYLDIRSTAGTEMILPERHAYWFDSSELAGQKIYEQRKPGSTSAENLVEAEMIMELLKKMERQYANRTDRDTPVTIGVISFYYDQVALIRQMLKNESFFAIDVDVNTVDRFQGKEKEIVFVSLVRNVRRASHNLDSHIAAFQRINVAFSRAQNLLIIVGAKDMYADQPVKITDMNNGEEKIIMAYREIIEMLDRKGTYFTSDEVLTDIKAEEIIQKIRQNQRGNEE